MPPKFSIQQRQLGWTSLLALTLLTARIIYLVCLRAPSDYESWYTCLTFAFLPWNLLLAWVPFWLANYLHRFGHRQLMAWLVAGLWLLFLPNAPYIVTDFIHLRPRADIPYWYDGMLLMVFAVAGLELFVASLQRVMHWWTLQYSRRSSRVLLVAILFLTGFGIYAGRFFRWNSWDAVFRPWIILEDVVALLQQPGQFLPDLWLVVVFPLCLGVWYARTHHRAPTIEGGYGHRAAQNGSRENGFWIQIVNRVLP